MSGESKVIEKNTGNKSYEVITDPKKRRHAIKPIEYDDLWECYKTQQALMWKLEELDFSKDYDDFITLDLDEQHFLKKTFAFFAISDGIVNINIGERLLNEITLKEAEVTYGFQMMMENIHGETYSRIVEVLIKDPQEKNMMFRAAENYPEIEDMVNWGMKWTKNEENIAKVIVAFVIFEGVFFSGSFATIFWMKKYKNKGKSFMDGVVNANKFIARDEGLHCIFGCKLYSHVINKLPTEEVHGMIADAVEIAKKFMRDALQCKLIGMNFDAMSTYIEYVADTVLKMLGYKKLYKAENPFDFMKTIGLTGKSNFFENRPTDYQDAYIKNISAKKSINILDDF